MNAFAFPHGALHVHTGLRATVLPQQRSSRNKRIGLGLQLAFVASVNGYGRSLEHEVDLGGFEKMAAEVYRTLLDDHGESGRMEVFVFGSHPQLEQRIENAEAWAENNPDVQSSPPSYRRRPNADVFAKRMRPVVRRDDSSLPRRNSNVCLPRCPTIRRRSDSSACWN